MGEDCGVAAFAGQIAICFDPTLQHGSSLQGALDAREGRIGRRRPTCHLRAALKPRRRGQQGHEQFCILL